MPIIVSGSAADSGASNVTLGSLIERIREAAQDRPHRDELAGAITSTATSITFDAGVEVAKQALVNIDFEVARIVTKTSATVANPVVRGWDGSTAAAHGDGDSVLVGYRFSDQQYRRAVNQALNAIGYAFGRPQWYTAGAFSSDRLLGVPNTARRVFAVREDLISPLYMRDIPFRFLQAVPTTLVDSGKAVQLYGYNPGSGTAYIGYETAWTQLVNRTDELDDEFPADAIDLIETGAIAYLLDGQTFQRAAYGEPHVINSRALGRVSEVRLAAANAAQHFLARRSELAARMRA